MLVSSAAAVRVTTQHRSPCSDCPWRRDSLRGWLGGLTPDAWLRGAHGDELIDCHTRIGAQCAGAATYRANTCKVPRDPSALRLQADRVGVFAWPQEFLDHHQEATVRKKPKLPRVPVPKPQRAFVVRKDTPFRKRKHKGQEDR